jgi:hypothetical protein
MTGSGGRPDGAALAEERATVDLQLTNEQDLGLRVTADSIGNPAAADRRQ